MTDTVFLALTNTCSQFRGHLDGKEHVSECSCKAADTVDTVSRGQLSWIKNVRGCVSCSGINWIPFPFLRKEKQISVRVRKRARGSLFFHLVS